jgi:hypothetical protein
MDRLAFGAPFLVIAFIVLTSLINISLGYLAAVYVGNTRARLAVAGGAELPATDASAGQSRHQSSERGAVDAGSERRHAERVETWRPAEDAAAAPPAVEQRPVATAKPAAEVEPALETDLLAGIEEFRSQLAQMKGEPQGAISGASLASV